MRNDVYIVLSTNGFVEALDGVTHRGQGEVLRHA